MERTYDLVVILDPDLDAEGQEKLLEKIKKLIAEVKGEISTVKQWGRKELVYPILKKRSGFFVEIKFSVSKQSTSSLRQKFQLEEKILRYLLVVEEPASAPPKGGATAR